MSLRLAATLLALCLVAGPHVALAQGAEAQGTEDIKDKVPDALLAQYCTGKDYVTANQVSLMLPDGSTITGTITCAAEDLIVGDGDSTGADVMGDPMDSPAATGEGAAPN